MKQKTFFTVFEGLSFGEKTKICYKIADTSLKEHLWVTAADEAKSKKKF